MTAPVSQDAGSEKIAMTAPVSQERTGGQWRIAFVMPSEYTMDTLPEPVGPEGPSQAGPVPPHGCHNLLRVMEQGEV